MGPPRREGYAKKTPPESRQNDRFRTETQTPQPKIIALWITLLCVFIVELLVYTWVRVQCVRVATKFPH